MGFSRWRRGCPFETWRQLLLRLLEPVGRNRGLRRWGDVGMRSVDSVVNIPLMGGSHRSSPVIGSVVAWRNSREWNLIQIDREAGWLLWNDNGFDRTKKAGAHGRGLVHIDRKHGWLRRNGIAKRLPRLIGRRRRLTMAEASTGGPLI